MEPGIAVSSVMLALALMITIFIETTTGVDLTPRRLNNEFKSCTTKTGADGKCVDWSYCNDKYEIEKGGIIADSELRSFECNKIEWCCSEKNVTKPPPPKQKITGSSNCIVTELPDCPWCVKLYRDGTDRRRRKSGFFCMGILIGTRVVLTTGTCMVQANLQNLWARFPSTPDPNINYTINFRLLHPGYNSGTRENDLALLTVDPEPDWDERGPKGACLSLEKTSLVGQCIGAGVDDNENILMTPLIVAEGNCGRGSPLGSSCGHTIGDACSIIDGAPIMCNTNDNTFIASGLSKLSCVKDPPQSLLNDLVHAEKWINDRLKGTMGLIDENYRKLST